MRTYPRPDPPTGNQALLAEQQWHVALGAALHAKAAEIVAELPPVTDRVAALRTALEAATAAEVWDVVARLAGELDAELKAGAGVVDLEAERVRSEEVVRACRPKNPRLPQPRAKFVALQS